MHELTINASNFQFQGNHFDVPAGITDVRLVSIEGTHGLGSDAPELAYLDLITVPPQDAAKVDFVSHDSIKVDFVGKNIPTAPHWQVAVRLSEMDGTDEVLIEE